MADILSGITRQIATDNSDEARLQSLLQKHGLVDTKGKDLTEEAETEQVQARDGQAKNLQKILDHKPEPPETPKAPAEGAAPSAISQLDPTYPARKLVFNAAMGGAADGIQNIANAAIGAADYIDNHLGNGKLIPDDYKLDFAKDWFPKSDSSTLQVLRGASQFIAPYSGLTRLTKVGTFGKAMAGIAVDALAFSGDQERVSNLIQSDPDLANPITAWLASKEGDSELEGRAKNVIEGLGLAGATESVIKLGSGVWKVLKLIKNKSIGTQAIKQAQEAEHALANGKPVGDTVPVADTVTTKPDLAADNASFDKSLAKLDGDIGAGKKVVTTQQQAAARVPRDLLEKVDAKPEDLLKSVDEIGKGGGYQLNLERIDADSDVLGLIKNFAEKDKAAIETRIGPAQGEKQLPLLAKQLGITVEDLLAKHKGSAFTASELYAARTFHAAAAENLISLAKVAESGSDADKYAFMQGMQSFKAINHVLTGAKAEAGRALKSLSFRVKAGDPRSAEMIQAFLENTGLTNVKDLAKNIGGLSPEDVSKVVRKTKFNKWVDAAFEVRVNNLLSRVTTLVKNEIGNFSMAWYTNMERGLAPFWKSSKAHVDPAFLKTALAEEKALRSIDKSTLSFEALHDHEDSLKALNHVISRAAGTSFEHGEMAAAASGMNKEIFDKTMSQFSGFFDGMRGLKKTVLSNDPDEYRNFFSAVNDDYFTKTEGYPVSISSDNLGGGPAMDIFGGIQRIPSKALNWRDDFYKAINYRGEVHAQGWRLGIQQGMSGEELSNYVQEFAKDPPDSIRLMGEQRARINTFTNTIDGSWGEKIHDMIQSDVKGVQPLKWVIPFARTPINISYAVAKRTPLAVLTDSWERAMSAGGAQAQLAKTQMALGTSVMGTMAGLSYFGVLKGKGSADYKTSNLQKDTEVPYSFDIGGTKIPTSVLGEPMSSIVNIVADMGDAAHAIGAEWHERDASEMGALLAWTAVNHLGPDNMVRGFSELFDAIHSQDPKEFLKMAQNIQATMVPLTGMAKNFKNVSDPVVRDLSVRKDDPFPYLQGIINRVRDQIPGLSTGLPARKNMFGETITLPRTIGPEAISPFYTNKVKEKDVVLNELVRLGYDGPFAKAEPAPGESSLAITMPQRSISYGGATIPLDPHQYSQFVELAAGIGFEKSELSWAKGMTLKENLGLMIKENYPKLSPKFKTDENKRMLIKTTINAYRAIAQNKMFELHPDLLDLADKAMVNKEKAHINTPEVGNESE